MKKESDFQKEKTCTLEEVLRLEKRIKHIAYKSPIQYKNITLQPFLELQKNMNNMKNITPIEKMKILQRFLKSNLIFRYLNNKIR